MNLFDIIVLAIIICSTLMGLYKGLIHLTIGLIFFCISIGSTYFLFPLVEVAISEHMQNILAVNITSSLIAYLISMILCALLGNQVSKTVSGISGGLIDRILGLITGMLRGLIISSIIFGIIAIFTSDAYVNSGTAKDIATKIDYKKYPKWLTKASTYDLINSTAKFVGNILSLEALEEIKFPKTLKHSLVPAPELIDKTTEAAAQKLINHAVRKSIEPSRFNKSREVENLKSSDSDDHDSLDSQLKELFNQ